VRCHFSDSAALVATRHGHHRCANQSGVVILLSMSQLVQHHQQHHSMIHRKLVCIHCLYYGTYDEASAESVEHFLLASGAYSALPSSSFHSPHLLASRCYIAWRLSPLLRILCTRVQDADLVFLASDCIAASAVNAVILSVTPGTVLATSMCLEQPPLPSQW
jgi:hypothetical protein